MDKSDIQILYRETIRMSTYLLEQTRFTRLFLFLGSADRLALLLKYGYEKYAQNGILVVERNIKKYLNIAEQVSERFFAH